MVNIQQILTEYTRLRSGGMAAREALDSLSGDIEALPVEAKQQLVQQLRAYESGEQMAAEIELDSLKTAEHIAIQWLKCPHCGKSNQQGDVICYSCGGLIMGNEADLQTQALVAPDDLAQSDDYFGPDTVLILTAHNTEKRYEIRPQRTNREMILGRRTNSPMTPDVDLAAADANRLGVSRLHLSIRYDANYNTISVFDMGSANGTFVNGQRLHPHEVRVLRHRDEVRLGNLMMTITFLHSDD